MSQYRRPHPDQRTPSVANAKVCADCGHIVSPDDRYCAGCGVAFAGAPARVDRPTRLDIALPGFQYHLIQGLGWGLGFALASAVMILGAWMLIALMTFRIR
jgi:hypothetical protein